MFQKCSRTTFYSLLLAVGFSLSLFLPNIVYSSSAVMPERLALPVIKTSQNWRLLGGIGESSEVILKYDPTSNAWLAKVPSHAGLANFLDELARWSGVSLKPAQEFEPLDSVSIDPVFTAVGRPLPRGSFLINGVNCHGTSFYLAGLIDRPSYVGLDELNYNLETLCQNVPESTDNSIVVFHQKRMDSHSRFQFTRSLGFQKPSNRSDKDYQFMTGSPVFKSSGETQVYVCKPPPMTCKNENYLTMLKSTQRLDQELYNLSKSGNSNLTRDVIYQAIGTHLDTVESLYDEQTSSDCKIQVTRLQMRLQSLASWSQQIQGVGIFINQGAGLWAGPKF